MIAALLGIDIQDPAFAFRQMRPVVQHLLSCQGSGDKGGDIECLLGFALPVDALKLPRVAMVELSIQIICGGVSYVSVALIWEAERISDRRVSSNPIPVFWSVLLSFSMAFLV